jgi:hypothetical protein
MLATNWNWDWMMLEKLMTPSIINYTDFNGRTFLQLAIEYSDEKYAKDCILKVLQMGADVTQEGTRWYENELPVETAVKYDKSKWNF